MIYADELTVTTAHRDGDRTDTYTKVHYLHTWNRLNVVTDDGTTHRIDKANVVDVQALTLAAPAA